MKCMWPVIVSTAAFLLFMEILVRSPWGPLHVEPEIAPRYREKFFYPTNPRGYFEEFEREGSTVFGIRPGDTTAETVIPPPGKLEGKKKFLFLGDSFTRGQGVRWKDTFPKVFNDLMNENADNSTVVFNSAEPGASIRDVYLQLEEIFPDFHPEKVIYGYVLNDPVVKVEWNTETFLKSFALPGKKLREPIFDLMNYRDFGRTRNLPGRILGQSSFFRVLMDRYDRSVLGKQAIVHYTKLHSSENSKGMHLTEHILIEMNNACERAGSSFIVMIFPVFYKLDSGYPLECAHEMIGTLCERNNIEYLDLLQIFAGRDPTALRVHPVDLHPNEIAHEMVAEYLFEYFNKPGEEIDGNSHIAQIQ